MNIEIENLSFAYSTKPILDNWNLRLEFKSLVLMGPSGCGKSTFLRILAGLSQPTKGRIKVASDYIPMREAELLEYRKKMGLVFQSYNLFPHLSVLTNVALPLFLVHDFSRSDAEAKAEMYLKKFGLAAHIDKKPNALSGGQKQRVALLRSIVTNPKLLLLDEPTSALDPFMSQEVIDFVGDLIQEKNVPVVLVTHNIRFAKLIGGNLLFVKNGKIIETGDTVTLLSGTEEDCLRKFKNT